MALKFALLLFFLKIAQTVVQLYVRRNTLFLFVLSQGHSFDSILCPWTIIHLFSAFLHCEICRTNGNIFIVLFKFLAKSNLKKKKIFSLCFTMQISTYEFLFILSKALSSDIIGFVVTPRNRYFIFIIKFIYLFVSTLYFL